MTTLTDTSRKAAKGTAFIEGSTPQDVTITPPMNIPPARDTGLGPDYINFDIRLGWEHTLGESAKLRFTRIFGASQRFQVSFIYRNN